MGYYERVEFSRDARYVCYHEEATVVVKEGCEVLVYTYSGVYIIKAKSVKIAIANTDKIKTICEEGD